MTAVNNIFVPIAGGVKSSRSDRMLGAKSPTLLSVGEGVIQLANGIVDRFWQVIKRSGGVALPMTVFGGGGLPTPWRLAGRGSSLVSLSSYGSTAFTEKPAYAFSPTQQRWIPAISAQRGPVKFARTRVAAGQALESPDTAYLPGYYATAHLDRFGNPTFTLVDEASNQVIFTDRRGTGTDPGTHVKVVACAGLFTMIWDATANGLKVVTYNPATFVGTPHTLGGGVLPSVLHANVDAIAISPTVIKIVYQNSTLLQYIDYTPSTGASVTGELTTAAAGHIIQDAMCWVRDLANTGHVSLVTVGGDSGSAGALGVAMAGGGARLHYNITGGTPASTLAIDGGQIVAGHAPVMRVTAHSRSAAAQDVLTLVELGATASPIPNVDPVDLATAAILPSLPFGDPDYAVGATPPVTAVGATITSTDSTNALVVDGTAPTVGMRILVKDQIGAFLVENGIYIATRVAAPWVLTRATDFDSANELGVDVIVKVTGGATNAGRIFVHRGAPSQMQTVPVGSAHLSNPSNGTPIVFSALSAVAGNDRAHRSVLACASAGGVATQATWMLGLGISSVPFNIAGNKFILADYDNTPYPDQAQPLQSSLFLVELPPAGALPSLAVPPVSQANIAVGNGGGLIPPPTFFGRVMLSNVSAVAVNAAGETVVPIKVRMDGTASGSGRGIEICRISNAANLALGNLAEFGGSLIIPGAVVSLFDGSSVTALGFSVFPEPPTVSAGPVGNDVLPVICRWQTVYRTSDALGRIHRSRPSAPADVKVPAGPLNAVVSVTPYRLGDKQDVTIELYRSAANVPEVLYYVAEVVNDPTVQTQTINDTATDSAIAVNELLYTTGGVLGNDPLPGASEVCLHGGRLFIVSMDDPTQVGFSQPNNGFDGPGFPSAFEIQRPSAVTGLASFTEKLVIFENGVFFVAPSSGPDAQGRGLFPDPQTLDPGVETAMPLSICVAPDGVFFRTTDPLDGIQMVSKSLQVVPRGLDVQKYNAPVTAAAFIKGQGQARFWTAFGPTLVYDQTHDLWSTFTNQDAATAALWNGVPVYYGGGAIVQEQPGTWTENGIVYDLDIFSPWFSPASSDKNATVPNVGGYFLLRDILGIGSGQAGPTLVELRQDFDTAKVVASFTGTPGPKFDWVVRGAWKQSCFQVRIRETSATAGPVINGFTVGVAPKKGPNRLASGKSLRAT